MSKRNFIVKIGSQVRVSISNGEKNFSRVFVLSCSPGENHVSPLSPVGMAILKKRTGDSVQYAVNGKIFKAKIDSVIKKL